MWAHSRKELGGADASTSYAPGYCVLEGGNVADYIYSWSFQLLIDGEQQTNVCPGISGYRQVKSSHVDVSTGGF